MGLCYPSRDAPTSLDGVAEEVQPAGDWHGGDEAVLTSPFCFPGQAAQVRVAEPGPRLWRSSRRVATPRTRGHRLASRSNTPGRCQCSLPNRRVELRPVLDLLEGEGIRAALWGVLSQFLFHPAWRGKAIEMLRSLWRAPRSTIDVRALLPECHGCVTPRPRRMAIANSGQR